MNQIIVLGKASAITFGSPGIAIEYVCGAIRDNRL